MVQKEKEAITTDKKGFYNVMFPKFVKPDDKGKKKIDEN